MMSEKFLIPRGNFHFEISCQNGNRFLELPITSLEFEDICFDTEEFVLIQKQVLKGIRLDFLTPKIELSKLSPNLHRYLSMTSRKTLYLFNPIAVRFVLNFRRQDKREMRLFLPLALLFDSYRECNLDYTEM